MFYGDICKILGMYLYGFTAAAGIPFLLGLYYHFVADPTIHPQPHTEMDFLYLILVSLGLAMFCQYMGRKATGHVYRREALAIVVIIWVFTPALSALPFWTSQTLTNYIAGYFEAVSGLTTTGATTLEGKKYDPQTGVEIPIVKKYQGLLNTSYSFYGTIKPVRDPATGAIVAEGIDAISKPILYWRSFLQWLGGGGVIVLFVAILPVLGVGGKFLFQTEVAGPIKDPLTPRIKETAITIWKIYLGLTVLQIMLLMTTNPKMEWLDAITLTFATLSTGGFGIHSTNVAYYQNPTTEWIIIIFMILGSINFYLYFYVAKGKLYKIFEPEFLLYAAVLLFTCSLASWYLVGSPEKLILDDQGQIFDSSDAIRYGTFQIVSAITSTGFFTANYDYWPYVVQALMLIVMFIGGMSGSTAGGIKIIRHYMLFRICQDKVEALFRPSQVRTFKVGNREVDPGVTLMVLCYFFLAMAVAVAGTFLYILDGIDPQTALGLVACMENNTGLAFRVAGPEDSCAFMSNFSYMLSSLLMILGRLEYFALFAMLVPSFWKQG